MPAQRPTETELNGSALRQPPGRGDLDDASGAAAADLAARLLDILRDFARDNGIDQALDRIGLDSRLEADLGLDSLGRSELIARLERGLGCRLSDEALLAATAADLLTLARADSASAAPANTHAAAAMSSSHEAGAAMPAEIPVGDRAAVSAKAHAHAHAKAEASAESETAWPTARLPTHAETLLEMLDWHLERQPSKTHILLYESEDQPRPISYADLAEGAARMAGGLRAAGLQPQQTVALMLPTGADYFQGFFGVLQAGGIPVPIYPPARPEQIEEHLRRHVGILTNAGARVLITLPEALRVARLLRAWVPSLQAVLTPQSFADVTPAALTAHPQPDDIALLQYTSGSTGAPKGVVLSHADLLANIRAMGSAVAARPDDCFVSWLPLYHDMGLIGAWLGSLCFGIPLVSMSPLSFLARPLRWLKAIDTHRGSLSAAPNFAYELCLKRIQDEDLDDLDLSCWRRALNGAEPVGSETLRRFAERFGRCGLRAEALAPVYGLAEAAVGLTFPPATRGPVVDCIDRERFAVSGEALRMPCQDTHAMQVVSCGRPLSGYRLRILDQDGQPRPERLEGRLYFQGPSATRGYYRNPQATAALIQDGWHDTGDRGYLAAGELYLTGRIKDLIIRGGRNLYPYEVEQAVGELSGVRKGCVVAFAAADEAHGSERLVLVAETRERDPTRRTALLQRVRARATEVLGSPPDEILLVPPRSVLKTSSGKLRRGATRERWSAGRLTHAPPAPFWQLLRLGVAGLLASSARSLQHLPAQLYAGYAWLLFGLIAPWVWLGIMTLPRLRWRWRLVRAGVGLLRRLAFVSLTVRGAERIPAPNQPFVIASNHQSYLDVAALVEAIDRPLAFVAKQGLKTNPLVRWPLERLGTLFVDRFDLLRGPEEARRFAAALARGQTLGFFPEGTFLERPGLLPFRMGAFLAATAAGVPLLPVALRGTRELMRGTRFFPHPGRALIEIGEPIWPEDESWRSAVQLRDQARAFIEPRCEQSAADSDSSSSICTE
ncbi:AMP-binding protein [Halochromatium roseum]|uniref:AMP-binding protein n=1 Tax=Halochromatium roseum TaxID=391920 RepID=UPI001F5DAB98|nr:AMP-binding protein [Halochromatium roseum]MBK5940178.1 acyl-phosphate glycerol 3-phosphate acyltransferase [Halochromatium roseum]